MDWWRIIFIGFLLGLIFFIFFLAFFTREPRLEKKKIDSNVVLSPSYGTIFKIINDEKGYIHIIIILNLFDIHTQYYPIHGKVIEQIYDANGNFHLVYELFKSSQNEKVITTIEPVSSNIPGNIIVQQIAGMFVRRIETSLTQVPEDVSAGQKLGRIRFGSRVDLIVPREGFVLNVSEGQEVLGPETIIGEYK
jgi:phosphatidylserine decarboxylase